MTEPCYRHSRADSALHGDECAKCLRADLAAARADVARLRDALDVIAENAPKHSYSCDCDACQFSRLAAKALAAKP